MQQGAWLLGLSALGRQGSSTRHRAQALLCRARLSRENATSSVPSSSLLAALGFATSATDPSPMVKKLLVANRGEIACRILSTARKLGVPTVAVFSEADRRAKHVELADESFCIGAAAARDSYLRGDAILDVAARSGATAVHPGYGFLSENAAFAEACAAAGLAFVGPPAAAIRAMGDKSRAKEIMQAAGVPVVPGYHGADQSEERLLAEAARVGFPLLVKAVSGGGGKGMKLATGPHDLKEAISSARREALASFNDDRLLLERYVQRPRHVEVQVFADGHGGAVYLFDRDCSVQRRHQKIIEEAPAPGLPEQFHRHIGEAAVRAARAVGYRNAGTVEFIVDTDSPDQQFYFMEMNTRLQVEHPVSEAITGQDFVEWQLRVAAGGRLPRSQDQLAVGGHSFEARIYAESPRNGFLPGAGTVRRWRTPSSAATFANAPVRVDSGVREGDAVGTFYDPMIAKLVTHGPDRATALAALVQALKQTQVAGLPTNIPFLLRLATHPDFVAATRTELTTAFIARHREALLAPQPVPDEVAALAAVARHLLAVRRQAEAEAAQGLAARLGPWGSGGTGGSSAAGGGAAGGGGGGDSGAGDSWRLWHSHRRTYSLRHPEGGAGGAESAGGELHLALTVLGGGDFLVERTTPSLEAASEAAAAKAAAAATAAGHGHHSHKHSRASPVPTSTTATATTAPAATAAGGAATATATPAGLRVRGASLSPDGGRVVAEVGGRRLEAAVLGSAAADGGGGGGGVPVEHTLDLWLSDGEHFHFTWPEPTWSCKAGAGAAGGAGGGSVAAPMPGRVVAVMVAEGDTVKAGAQLVALEAMKMEHAVVAPRPGAVEAVLAAPGQQVAQGQVLVVIRPAEGAEAAAGEGPKDAAKAAQQGKEVGAA
ncbi:hypothetical protein HYH02_008667 [Chlamydomonas schloesseri]|uniref:Uncharacterized protein n=1 Tax=Chlamydomonas schloesseri TaxID=2026947 RepID=A0A835WD06_9CHLO|nr:hypothetical protein HYH02_008667 [Chlamydomonas schloesseri]|eukprot:KAG2445199.1 hypothetical protein HYH02_008667 [Chlamydomonas schloesseri]